MEEQARFQVNLGGLIELLGGHLYSSPDVFVRELVQNGVDAVTARRGHDPELEGRVIVRTDGASVIEVEESTPASSCSARRCLLAPRPGASSRRS